MMLVPPAWSPGPTSTTRCELHCILGFWVSGIFFRQYVVSLFSSHLYAHQLIERTFNEHIYDGFPTSPFGTDCTARLAKLEAVVILRKRGLCVLPVDSNGIPNGSPRRTQ